jgi:sugar/nucleoside kinase (ribokinase family)
MEQRPDYLVIGHVAKDRLPDGGSRPGGTVTYSALAVQRLGLQAAVVTACAPEDEDLLAPLRDAGVWVAAVPSERTTSFLNVYDDEGHRTQFLLAQADPIEWGDVPVGWRGAPIVHLGPIAQELPAGMPGRFPYCLLGITPQGWMRSWDGEGRVAHSAWPVHPALNGLPDNACLVLSIEDLDYHPELVQHYVNLAPVVVITSGYEPALLYRRGDHVVVPAFPAESVDPTGAGDVFAAALLVYLHRTGDLERAAGYAHATAAFCIEGEGVEGLPTAEQVERRAAEGA